MIIGMMMDEASLIGKISNRERKTAYSMIYSPCDTVMDNQLLLLIVLVFINKIES